MTDVRTNLPLTDRVALVTEASRGIGRAIAERLAMDGTTVVVNYRSNAEAAQAVVQRIENAGGTAVAEQADMGQLNEIHRLFDLTTEHFGRLDILVNNAGTSRRNPSPMRRKKASTASLPSTRKAPSSPSKKLRSGWRTAGASSTSPR